MTPAQAHANLQALEVGHEAHIQELMADLKLGHATVATLFLRGGLLDKGFAPIPLFYGNPPELPTGRLAEPGAGEFRPAGDVVEDMA